MPGTEKSSKRITTHWSKVTHNFERKTFNVASEIVAAADVNAPVLVPCLEQFRTHPLVTKNLSAAAVKAPLCPLCSRDVCASV